MKRFGYNNEYPNGDLSLTFHPLNPFPNPLDSELTISPSPARTNFSPVLTGDDAAHVDNLLYFGVDSPVLPPDILASLLAEAETALHPLNPFPNPLDSELTISPLPARTNFSPVLTGDDAAHVDNLPYFAVDSPVLPPDILASLLAEAETALAFGAMPPNA
ncbi:hypothetical protein FRC00_002874, partial [Tulasnella sp. 408]